MTPLTEHYTQLNNQTKTQLQTTSRTIHWIGSLRLVLVIGGIIATWLLWGNHWHVLSVFIPIILILAFLIHKHSLFFKRKSYLERSIITNENELRALKYDFNPFDGGKEYINSSHPFTFDLDIFGDKSLFQSINRTSTQFGKTILSDWFANPLNDKTQIINRQSAIQELAKKSSWMHRFEVTGKAHSIELVAIEQLNTFSSYSHAFTKPTVWKALIYIIPTLWILYITGIALDWLAIETLPIAIIVGIFIGESQYKKIDKLQHVIGKEVLFFSNYSELIELIEQESFNSALLKESQQKFNHNHINTSKLILALSKSLDNLDIRHNTLGRIALNTLFLWDIRTALQIEQWNKQHGPFLKSWMNTLGTFDALISLGRFSFNHPNYISPKIADTYFQMQGTALGHPLLHEETCVRNDINIESHPYFLIVTGANMAGKSTYLRTIGVNFLLSCIGAPVCAESLCIYPANLLTSLRTSDSLSDQESYFFAELKRLKMIIDELQAGKELFIILDEILKGTNSVDKQKGSLALIRQFITLKTCGIIATHDILLGELETAFPNNIKNYRFEADIHNEELHFSYKMQTGVAQNMNACFLMKKMGITI